MRKALYKFKVKRVHEANENQFPFLQPVELTQKIAIETKAKHSWYPYVVTVIGHYYTVIIKAFNTV